MIGAARRYDSVINYFDIRSSLSVIRRRYTSWREYDYVGKEFCNAGKVFCTSESAEGAGVRSSVRELPRALGGSATTISGLLREWKAKDEIEAPTSPEDIEIPADVMAAAEFAQNEPASPSAGERANLIP